MKRKQLASMLLVAVMTIGTVAGCGGSGTAEAPAPADTQTETAQADAPAAETPAAEAPAAEAEQAEAPAADNNGTREKVTFMAIDLNAGQSNVGEYADQIIQQINDYCNVDLEINWVLNDSLEERGTLELASPSTMPMIMTWGGSTVSSPVAAAARDGAFVNLNDYIWDAEKYPNLSQLDKDAAEALTMNGQLFAIPRSRELGRYGLSYRQDWADKLGLSEPKTPEDVFNMIHAFTYDDPDGNGKDDTIGMEMCSYTGPFDIIQSWFGVGTGWAEVDGKLIPNHMQPEYKEALDFIKSIYDDGGMPANWAEIPTDTWSNGVKNGENGIYIDVMDGGRRVWDYFEDNAIPAATGDGIASMNLLGAINGKTPCLNIFNGYFTLSATTCDTPEKIEAALRLLDRLNDNEMRLLTEFGIEGVNYNVEDGVMVKLDADTSDDKQIALAGNYKGLNQMLAYVPNFTPQPAVASNERKDAQEAVYKKNREAAVFNPALALLSASTTYQANGSVIDQYIAEARSQYITGAIDWAGFEAAQQRWLSEGGQAIIDEVNAMYNK